MSNAKMNNILYKNRIDPKKLIEIGDEVLTPSFYKGLFIGEYSEVLKLWVSSFLSMRPLPPMEFRIKAIELLMNAYIVQTGEAPSGVQLCLLANWILAEELSNPHPDKVTLSEAPILNKGQLRKRHRREAVDEHIHKRWNAPIAKKRYTNQIDVV